MTPSELFDKVAANENLEGLGIVDTDKGAMLLIKHKPSCLTTQLPLAAIEKLDWPSVEQVLVGQREPVVLQHMSRVVGYYSRIQNWNASKLGELQDRHKGNYTVQESAAQ